MNPFDSIKFTRNDVLWKFFIETLEMLKKAPQEVIYFNLKTVSTRNLHRYEENISQQFQSTLVLLSCRVVVWKYIPQLYK
jgi:hypothetical protein